MTVGVLANASRDTDLTATRGIISTLEKGGFAVCADAQIAGAFPGLPVFDARNPAAPRGGASRGGGAARPDLILTVGGDGTILGAVEAAAARGAPILGINLGTVGFLTELERDEFPARADALKNGEYTIEERAMLELSPRGGAASPRAALNEVNIRGDAPAKMIDFDVLADGVLLDSCAADGLIVSTPTGSTAYSLSAGGPVLEPFIKGIVLTPVSAFSLHSRPVVLDDKTEVRVRLKNVRGSAAALFADGAFVRGAAAGEEIVIKKARRPALFVRFKPQNFLSRLRLKIGGQSGGRA